MSLQRIYNDLCPVAIPFHLPWCILNSTRYLIKFLLVSFPCWIFNLNNILNFPLDLNTCCGINRRNTYHHLLFLHNRQYQMCALFVYVLFLSNVVENVSSLSLQFGGNVSSLSLQSVVMFHPYHYNRWQCFITITNFYDGKMEYVQY